MYFFFSFHDHLNLAFWCYFLTLHVGCIRKVGIFLNFFGVTSTDVVGNHRSDAVGAINTSDNRVSVDVSNLDMLPGVGLGEQHQSPRNAWVSCDDCHKWRRIPAGLADLIDETKCTWYTVFFILPSINLM